MSWGVATQNGVSVSLASIVSLSCGATEFSPASLFTSGVAGAWYDPSDINNYMAGLGPEATSGAWLNGYATTFDTFTSTEPSSFTATTTGAKSPRVRVDLSIPATGWYVLQFTPTFSGGSFGTSGPAQVGAPYSPSIAVPSTLPTTSGIPVTTYFYATGPFASFVLVWSATGASTLSVTGFSIKQVTTIANATLFQDSAGTTPVTAVEQPVGLMLDKSQGLVLGSELVTNGDFSGGTTGWTAGNSATLSTTGGKLSVVNGAVSLGQGRQTITTVAGKTYKLSVTFTSVSASRGYVFVGTFAGDNSRFSAGPLTTSQTVTAYFTAAGTSTYLSIGNADNSIGLEVQFDDVTVKDIAGNHASQATAASRPILRARYNLLTYSEQFDNAAWTTTSATVSANTTATTDPLGGNTADSLVASAASSQHRIYQAVTSSDYTLSVYAKAGTASFISLSRSHTSAYATFNLSTGVVSASVGGTATIQSAGNGWWRCAISSTVATSYLQIAIGVTAANAEPNAAWLGAGENVYVWGAQTVTGSSAGTYQRIAAATDYATAGFLPYLEADGADDSMSIPSTVLTGATSATEMHSAWRPAGNADGNGPVFGGFGTDSIADHEPFSDNTLYSGFASTTRQTFATLAAIENPYILEQVQTGTTLAAYRNGTQLSTTKTVNFALGSTLRLFFSTSGVRYYRGRFFGGITISKVLSASETTSLRNYLAAKSGVTL